MIVRSVNRSQPTGSSVSHGTTASGSCAARLRLADAWVGERAPVGDCGLAGHSTNAQRITTIRRDRDVEDLFANAEQRPCASDPTSAEPAGSTMIPS